MHYDAMTSTNLISFSRIDHLFEVILLIDLHHCFKQNALSFTGEIFSTPTCIPIGIMIQVCKLIFINNK